MFLKIDVAGFLAAFYHQKNKYLDNSESHGYKVFVKKMGANLADNDDDSWSLMIAGGVGLSWISVEHFYLFQIICFLRYREIS